MTAYEHITIAATITYCKGEIFASNPAFTFETQKGYAYPTITLQSGIPKITAAAVI